MSPQAWLLTSLAIVVGLCIEPTVPSVAERHSWAKSYDVDAWLAWLGMSECEIHVLGKLTGFSTILRGCE